MDKRKQARVNKAKGTRAEQYFRLVWRNELGYPKCETARYASRQYDDCKIDLVNIPILIQIKAGQQKYLNVQRQLDLIRIHVKEKFLETSPEQTMPRAVLVKHDVGKGKKETEEHQLIYMYQSELLEFIESICEQKNRLFIGLYVNDIIYKDKSGVVCMTFEKFKSYMR